MTKKCAEGKKCIRCEMYKSMDDFGTDNGNTDKKTRWCKQCNKVSKQVSRRRIRKEQRS